MSLPLPFLSSLLLLLSEEYLNDSLPGQASLAALAPFLPLVLLPALIAWVNGRALRRVIDFGWLPGTGLRTRFVLQEFSIPFAYGVMLLSGGLAEYLRENLPSVQILQISALLAPLLAMEISLRLLERRSALLLSASRIDGFANIGNPALGMVFFLLTPLLLFSAAVDLLYLDRNVELFFSVTSLGSTLGLVLLALAMCVFLPLVFRWVLPTSSHLPEALAQDIRKTAAQLGFSPRAVLSMDTNHRIANAAMVGALPWPRYLVLTDGLLSLLDPDALRGVVAHEVGHARAGHPGLLLLILGSLGLLLLNPLLIEGFESANGVTQSILGGLLFGTGFFCLRGIAHRFEFEADKLAAEALGGAEACISALSRVASLHPMQGDRNSFRHPSYRRRIRNLLAWEQDSGYRRHFEKRGRNLRYFMSLFLLASLISTAWSQFTLWPVDRAVVMRYSGNFAAAHEQILALDADLPGIDPSGIERLDEEVLAAITLVGPNVDWLSVRDSLAEKAWRRGVEQLSSAGAVAARPWFALALSRERSSPLERSLYRYCLAASDEDVEAQRRLADHLFALGVPKEIGDAITAGR